MSLLMTKAIKKEKKLGLWNKKNGNSQFKHDNVFINKFVNIRLDLIWFDLSVRKYIYV